MKEFQKDITVLKRTIKNYTHNCIIDDSIVSITAWRRSKHKFQLFLILHLFTLGIVHLISLFIPSMYLSMYCKQSSGLVADYFLITDKNNKQHLVTLEKIALENKDSFLSTFYKTHFGNDTMLRVFKYHYMTYIYRDTDNCVVGLYIDFTKYKNNDIHSFMTEVMDTENYKEHRNAFGQNIYKIPDYSLFRFFIIVELPMNFLVLISSIIFTVFQNFVLGGLYMLCLFLMIFLKYFYKSRVFKNVPIDDLAEDFSALSINNNIKNLETKNIKNISLIPGDFIVLKKGQIIPCDCLLLEGECVVNENKILGKTSVNRKCHLPKNEKNFNYSENYQSLLCQGSKIIKCHSSVDDNKSIIAIAVNTGANTFRSNLFSITQIDNPFVVGRLYSQKKILFIYTTVLFISCLIAMLYNYFTNPLLFGRINELIEVIIKVLIILFFPLYHIAVCVICLLGMISLKKKNVECIDESKLEISGKITTIVFDKTGTLSEDVLEVSGYQPVNYDNNEPVLLPIDEKEPKKLKFNHLKYWKEFKASTVSFTCVNNTEIHLIYYLHCLVTCHNLEKINNENCGALLEKEMLKKLKWEINAIKLDIDDPNCIDENIGTTETIEIYPKNYYKITEKAKFDRFNQTNKIFKLQIYKRFIGCSSQGISSIVKNIYDNSLRFFCKGQPEEILPKCLVTSLPKDIEKILANHRKDGFRLIACATKDLQTFSFKDKESFYFKDLTFLGFILLKNQLKKETKKVIEKLRKMNLELIMATGDSIYTSLSVAYESKFISDKNIYVFEIDKEKSTDEEKQILITHLYQKIDGKAKIIEDSISFSGRRLLNEIVGGNESSSVVFHKINKFYFEPSNPDRLDSMKHNSLYCLSGETFMYIFNQYKKELKSDEKKPILPFTKLIRYVKHLCKIYYFMSADNKAELISYLRSIPDKVVSMVGDGTNDIAAMMKSNVGISLTMRRICHYYSTDQSLECVEKIIKTGRATRENFLSLLLFFILASFIKGVLNVFLYVIGTKISDNHYILFEMLTVILSCLAFKINPDFDVDVSPLFQGPYFVQYSIVKIIGHMIIKTIQSISFFLAYKHNNNISDKTITNEVLCSYMFFLACVHVISSIFAFNIDAFTRKNYQGNSFVTFVLVLMEFYFLSLLTLTSWNFHSGLFDLLRFVSVITNYLILLGIPKE